MHHFSMDRITLIGRLEIVPFIYFIDHKTWKAVTHGLSPPMMTLKDKTEVFKHEKDWSPTEDEVVLINFKSLTTFYNGVNKNVSRLINTWEILETSYEVTSKVKISRLLLVTMMFENLKLHEEENINEFYVSLRDLSNESYALG